MVLLLCWMMLLIKQQDGLDKISFFYFTFFVGFWPTIKARIKESLTLVTSTGTFREKHSQPLFVTELTQLGIPVWIQTNG